MSSEGGTGEQVRTYVGGIMLRGRYNMCRRVMGTLDSCGGGLEAGRDMYVGSMFVIPFDTLIPFETLIPFNNTLIP
jgi:hypothetical protein